MKVFSRAFLVVLTVVSVASFAAAQIQPGTFSHIIIVIQENRTPDNLFGGAPQKGSCTGEDPFEPGVDIANGGYTINNGQRIQICDIQQPMNTGPIFDPGHFYLDWAADYDSGGMDGFCHRYTNGACPTVAPSPYSYIQKSDVQPYFDIATGYGFANYMFQTNEGPSFPAHQFLFTGTSSAVAPKDSLGYYLDFMADNPPKPNGFSNSGCAAGGADGYPAWNKPNGAQETDPRKKLNECYTHDSLVTNTTGDKGVSWRYYTPTVSNPSNPLGIIWDAPEGIPEVCYGQNQVIGGPCTSAEFTNHVVYPGDKLNGVTYDGAPILDDIASCNLQKISWVIPDQAWSDHPQMGGTQTPFGPSWVGNIVNAIGNSYRGGNCDYWGTHTNSGLSVEPTAIFVVWDDWGGFFDHVLPPDVYRSKTATNCPTSVQMNGWGCGYVYGFRVPLMVVSEYTQAGYVSGAIPSPGQTFPYVHDFGSILAFTEYNFNLPPIDQSGDNGYADRNAPDSVSPNIPLSDFFSVNAPRTFTTISTPYPPSTFTGFYTTPQNGVLPTPTGPDGTPGEEDD